MSAIPVSVFASVSLVVGVVLLSGTADLFAQHGGGRGGRTRPFICVHDCPDPTEGADLTRDDLKKFDHLMAVQATPEQTAAYAKIQQDVETAATELKILQQLLEKSSAPSPPSDYGPTVYHSLDKASVGTRNFLSSFSDAQKSGLKGLIKGVENADSDLGKEISAWNGIFQASQTPANLGSVAGSIDKALARFQSEEMALAREMSILPGTEQDLTFHLLQVTTSAEIAGQPVSMLAGGEATRTSVTDGRSLFDLRLVVDLSDLQDNITEILRSQLTSAPRCGQRMEVREAMLLPQAAAGLAVLHLHHERWICPPGGSEGGELLVAAGDPTIEVKLSPSADASGDLHLVTELGHIDADEVFRDSLTTRPLGAALLGHISQLVLSAMQKGTDLKAILPPAAREALTIRKAQFQAGGAGQLRLVLDGQLRFSEEQTKEFAEQLRQQLSAKAASPQ